MQENQYNTGINNLKLDLPSQVEFNKQKNAEQDNQITTLNSQINQLLSQAPAGFLPRVYYGLTSGDQVYRFTQNELLNIDTEGNIGTAYEIYSNNETDNSYIPAIAVKTPDEDLRIIIQGDYNYYSESFTIVNMENGNSLVQTLENVLSLQNASTLANYEAENNKEKQITVLNNLENNSKNVVFASLDLNSDGKYNWVEIGNFVDGVDGVSARSITAATYVDITSDCKIGDTLIAGETFTADGNSFTKGNLYLVTAISPLTFSANGNIIGPQGETGATGADGADGANGYTPYIQDGYWYINGTNTNVKAIGTDGTDGTDGQSFQIQSGLYSTPDNWGETGNVDGDGNALLQLPTLPTTGITGKGYVVYDPLTTPLAPFYDLYWANDSDESWTIMHPFSGMKGTDGTDGYTPYIQSGNWYINGVDTGVAATGPQGPDGQPGQNGTNGQDGSDGYTPYIQDGYWYINGVNTGTQATGNTGATGATGPRGADGKVLYMLGSAKPKESAFSGRWIPVSWSGLSSFNGTDIWTDGVNIYRSNGSSHYVLNPNTRTWSSKSFNNSPPSSFKGYYVWTDGFNIYYSAGSGSHYKYNPSAQTWSSKSWSGFSSFNGENIWTDGYEIYCSPGGTTHYKLNPSTSTWSSTTFTGVTNFSALSVFHLQGYTCMSDGTNCYFLTPHGTQWIQLTSLSGFSSSMGDYIWTDKYNLYYSNGNNQYYSYKLNTLPTNMSWQAQTWNGLTNFVGYNVWTDGNNIYYSASSNQYVLLQHTNS